MEDKEVKCWSYNMQDGLIQLWFDQQQRYILLSEKDLESMLSWIEMRKIGLLK